MIRLRNNVETPIDQVGHTSSFRPAAEAFLVFGLFFIIYVALPTQNYYWDGLIYGEYLEQVDGFGVHLFHPNHLIYNFLGLAVFRGLNAVQVVDRALFALQYLSIFFGAATVAIFYRICRRLFNSAYIGLAVTGVLAFAASWWRFATDANVYVISIFFLLLSFYFLYRDGPNAILAGLAFFAAMLFHELAILFFPAACVALWLFSKERRWRFIWTFTLLSGGLIALSYIGAYCATHDRLELRPFVHWITSYAGSATFGPDISTAAFWLVKGTRQLFVDGSINLVVRDVVSSVAVVLFCLAAIALVASLFFYRASIYRSLSAGGIIRGIDKRLIAVCAAWIGAYVGFLLLFEPGNTFYRLFYLPPLVLLFGAFIRSLDRPATKHYITALLMFVFALYNFVFYIYPNSQSRPETVVRLALDVEKIWNDETLVFFEPARPTDGVIRTVIYLNPKPVWRPVDTLTVEEVVAGLPGVYSKGGAVWFERAAFEKIQLDPIRYESLTSVFMVDPDSNRSAPKYNLEFVKLVPRRHH